MTSVQQPASGLVDDIKANLKSPDTTTSQTLNLLRALLGQDNGIRPEKKSVRKDCEIKSNSKSRTELEKPARRPQATKRKQLPNFEIHESLPPTIPTLNTIGRRKLATEIFNSTLKQLSNAAKARPEAARALANEKLPLKSRSNLNSLQQTSSNRRLKPEREVCVATPSNNLGAVVDCARVALDCLRELNLSEENIHAVDVSLENGALVLLDKTITLQLLDQAESQLQRIHDQYWKRRRSRPNRQESSKAKSILCCSLCLEEEDDKTHFKLSTSLQSQALRLAILKGPGHVSRDFVVAVRPESNGSPASMIREGLKLGHIESEPAGQQLRIVSLALSKMYSLCIEGTGPCTAEPECIFMLASAALQIKILSWKNLGHQPDLQRDVWSHVSRSIQRYFSSIKVDHNANGVVRQCLRSLQGSLQESSFDDTPPTKLSEYSEASSQPALRGTGSDILNLECELDLVDLGDDSRRLLLSCRIATLRLEAFPDNIQECFSSASKALECFEKHSKGSLVILSEILVSGVQLRKIAISLASGVELLVSKGQATETHLCLQKCCLRLVYSFLAYLMRITTALTCAPRISKDDTKVIPQDSLRISIAKTIEAVIATEKCSMARTAVIAEETNAALHRCLQVGELIQQHENSSPRHQDTNSFLRGLPVRISQIFWARFLNSSEQRLPPQQGLEILEESVAAVKHRPLPDRQKAFLGVKYERLSACYADLGNYSKALMTLSAAIAFNIEQGLLSDAVEESLSKPSDLIWDDRKCHFHALGRNLAAATKLFFSQVSSRGTGIWPFDDENLPAAHRCVLLERQISAALELYNSSVDKTCLATVVRRVLQLCTTPQYYCYRLRFASRILFLIARAKTLNSRDFLGDDFGQKTITNEMLPNATLFLGNLLPILDTTVSTQWALSIGQVDENLMVELVAKFKDTFSERKDQCSPTLVSDPAICMTQLRALGDFAGVLGNHEAQLDALSCLRSLQKQEQPLDLLKHVQCLTQIGTLQNYIQATIEAGKTFAEAEKMLDNVEDATIVKMCWSLGYADYLFNISNFDRCFEMMIAAQKLLNEATENGQKRPTKSRLQLDTSLCQGFQLASRIAFHRGSLSQALTYGRSAVKLSTALWTAIERQSHIPPALQGDQDTALQSLTEDISSLNISGESVRSSHQVPGATYWQQLSLHQASLRHLADLCAHHGLYQDALCYYQQAYMIAIQIASTATSTIVHSELALLYARAGEVALSSKILALQESRFQTPLSLHKCESVLNLGDIYVLTGHNKKARDCLHMVQSFLKSGEQKHVTALKSSPNSGQGKDKSTITRTKKSIPKKAPRSKAPARTIEIQEATQEVAKLARAPATLTQQRIWERVSILEDNIRLRGGTDESMLGPFTPEPGVLPSKMAPSTMVSKGLIMVQKALKIFSSDPVNSVLAETAMALPVRYRSDRRSGRVSFLQGNSPALVRKPGKVRQDTIAFALPDEGREALVSAHQLLRIFEAHHLGQLSSSWVERMHRALSQVVLLSTALSQPFSYSSLDVVLQSLVSKDIAQSREQLSIQAEAATAQKDRVQLWPSLQSLETLELTFGFSASSFGRFVESLPDTWSIVSLGLSHDKNELLLSKICRGRSPFVMRIPLARTGIEDGETHDFNLSAAKDELLEIIQQANLSAHDARGQGDKATRNAWYAEREALDKRLETLLANIENVWLGGFRGVLSSHSIDEALLSRFGQSMNQALEKHLPSRQKAAKSVKEKVELHAHVLELFTTMSFEDSNDFEDSIMDLLYFVVDILQFSGEPNAYDEIDFDAILIEVLDALRGYHDAYASNATQEARHTVLILDKELQAFPWESLPCLRGRPVTRMPSLSAIQRRLDLIRNQNAHPACYTIPATSGAYMLNPGSDLTSTHAAFQPTLQSQLPTFNAITNRKPTESEFEVCLTEHPLFLYFGHGSGAQYLRGRTIRKLKTCAVTLLMGCSSAKMTECGEFESYGMPGYYMHGGSAAVVGTLWDVTDRDIDRFAMKVMVEWGLVKVDAAVERVMAKTKTKGRGVVKGKSNEKPFKGNEEVKRGVIALDRAVSSARESCSLKYLNGAAPVVYGVPVLLE